MLALLSVGAAEGAEITVPAGFRVDVYAEQLGGARALAVDPEGVLLVSIASRGRVMALRDRRGTGRATEMVTILKDLELPHGLAFRGGHLYVAETGRIVRFLNVNAEVAGLARMGPIRHHADSVMAVLRSNDTAVHLVTILEAAASHRRARPDASLR